MDLLQDKKAESKKIASSRWKKGQKDVPGKQDGRLRNARKGGRRRIRVGNLRGTEGVANGEDEEQGLREEEVASLRLVGLGMQLHSKSYSARFSFSMQDLDVEVRFDFLWHGGDNRVRGLLRTKGGGREGRDWN